VCRSRRAACNDVDAARDLCDIVFDEKLGAGIRPIVQFRRSDVPKITHEAASNEVDEVDDVAILFGCVEGCEALVDEAVIVILARRALSPVLCVSF
jgi:hypothetical protein